MIESTSASELVELHPDHPGFRDPIYRARRNAIARSAIEHRPDTPPPPVHYTDEEHDVWRLVRRRLAPLHEAHVCRPLLEAARTLALDEHRIPQLRDVERRLDLLMPGAAFRMAPVAGLVRAPSFLRALARGVFLSTCYVRHASRPFYTPEPDVIHELVGHAASFVHPEIASANRAIGRAADVTDERGLIELERLYWFTFEFGAVKEDGRVKALGAGHLSSCAELEQLATVPELCAWDPERIVATAYDPTVIQPRVFVAESFDAMMTGTRAFLRHRFGVRD